VLFCVFHNIVMTHIINIYGCNVGGFANSTYSKIDILELINDIERNTIQPFIITFQELTDEQINVIRDTKKVQLKSVTSMQANPSKNASGKKYYSYNAILISNHFRFTDCQFPTSYLNNGRSTKWVEIQHSESEILFDVCSLHAKVGSGIEKVEPIFEELFSGRNRILCGDFNINSAELMKYAGTHKDHISNYIKRMNNVLWLGRGPDYIFTHGPNIEIVNFNSSLGMKLNKKIPHNVIRATIQLMSPKVGGRSMSRFVRFILM
jgi:hypothetical protein